jgi:hypothetical protein
MRNLKGPPSPADPHPQLSAASTPQAVPGGTACRCPRAPGSGRGPPAGHLAERMVTIPTSQAGMRDPHRGLKLPLCEICIGPSHEELQAVESVTAGEERLVSTPAWAKQRSGSFTVCQVPSRPSQRLIAARLLPMPATASRHSASGPTLAPGRGPGLGQRGSWAGGTPTTRATVGPARPRPERRWQA